MSSKIRADKWLWFARVAKSRSLTAGLIKSGKVRLNAQKFTSPSQQVGLNDVLTITLDRQIRVLRIMELGVRRGPAAEAQLLYADLSPPPPTPETISADASPAFREEGSGRPTKKQRRDMDRFHQRSSEEN